jgi:hypothetical protein
MKFILYVLGVSCILGLSSCQKEVDFAGTSGTGGTGGGGGGTSNGSLLVRGVQKQGTDSSVTVTRYDANKKLINITSTGKSNGTDVTNEMRLYRNSAGILTRRVNINPGLASVGVDSTIYTVHYDAASSRYTSMVGGFSLMGFDVFDSTAVTYDGGGKVTKTDIYQDNSLLGGGYTLSTRTKYTYGSDGSISKVELVTVDAGTGVETVQASYTYTYDNKSNPILGKFSTSAEALLLSHYDWISPHNASKYVISSAGSPGGDITVNLTMTYNSSGYPAGGSMTQTGQANSELRMYYQ